MLRPSERGDRGWHRGASFGMVAAFHQGSLGLNNAGVLRDRIETLPSVDDSSIAIDCSWCSASAAAALETSDVMELERTSA